MNQVAGQKSKSKEMTTKYIFKIKKTLKSKKKKNIENCVKSFNLKSLV